MGSGPKTKTEQTQNTNQSQNYNNQNQYGWSQTPGSADIDAYRNFRPQVDPGLGSQYANARNQFTSSFQNPLGGFASPQMRDAQQRAGLRQLNSDEAGAFRGAYNDVNNQRGGQLAQLAGLTAPVLLNTGSSGSGNSTGNMSGTGTSQQSGGLLNSIIGGGAQVASAALM